MLQQLRPVQFSEKLIPLMIRNALAGKPLPVYGDGKNVRDWLFVRDHCEAVRLVLERGRVGETYNIGGTARSSTTRSSRPSAIFSRKRCRAEGKYADLISS